MKPFKASFIKASITFVKITDINIKRKLYVNFSYVYKWKIVAIIKGVKIAITLQSFLIGNSSLPFLPAPTKAATNDLPSIID